MLRLSKCLCTELGLLCRSMIFLTVGSSALFEGVGQTWYGMLNNQNQTAAFESQEPKYVKILTISFLLLD